MFFKLTNNSFIKRKPGENNNIFSIHNNNSRGSIVINESASSILELCDGTNSIDDIIKILAEKYKEDFLVVSQYVSNFLLPLLQCGAIEELTISQRENIIRGSKEIYYPDIVCWEITDYCPLNCKHCYLPQKNTTLVSMQDINYILSIFDIMGVGQVQLTGGEALTHPHLEYIVDQLLERGITTAISTSAIYYTEDIFKILNKLKNLTGSCVRVSLDGNKTTHNYIRNDPKSYDNAIDFISKLCEMQIPCQVGTTLTNQTKEELDELVSTVKKLGVYFIEIGPVCEQGNAKKNAVDCNYNADELREFLSQLSQKYSDEKFSMRLPRETNKKNCGAGYGLIRIRPDLSVTPCPMTEFYLGNFRKDMIQEVMHESNSVFCNLDFPQDKYCKGCKKENECKNCTAQGFNNRNKVDNCVWYKNVEFKIKPYLEGR